MKKIALTQGKFAKVDDSDYDFLNKWKWTAVKDTKTFYATRHGKFSVEGNRNLVYMHRVILKTPKKLKTDHIDGDGLNNQRKNLRVCTDSQNAQNKSKPKNNTSGIKGVSWYSKGNKWRATINIQGKYVHLGYFTDKVDAYKAYCVACVKYHGDFARIK